MRRYTYIVWDFNGTLLDDLDASVEAVSDMLQKRGGLPMTRAWYYEIMEMPIVRYYEKIFDLTTVTLDQLGCEYAEGYARHFDLVRTAEGAPEAVAHFAAAGCRQVIISSLEQTRLREMVRNMGLEGSFDAVLGADNIYCESKVDRACAWQRALGVRPEEILVIGDLVHDWEMAQALGADCILVDCGHQARRDLEVCGCPVLHSLTELPVFASFD